MRQIKCEYCGKIFTTDAPRAKYCSPFCQIEGGKAMRKQWESRRPDYNHNYYLERKAAAQRDQ